MTEIKPKTKHLLFYPT